MSEWKCGKCGKEYDFDEYMDLPKIQAVKEDDNPKEQHGYTQVCQKCGYVFHKDKFKIRNSVEIIVNNKKAIIDVSTVFLELNHSGLWYETMLFNGNNSEVDLELYYQDRYETEKEAIKGHKDILEKLRNNKFKVIASRYELEFALSEQTAVKN